MNLALEITVSGVGLDIFERKYSIAKALSWPWIRGFCLREPPETV